MAQVPSCYSLMSDALVHVLNYLHCSHTPLSLSQCLLLLMQVQIATIANQNWELPAHPGCIVAYNNRYITYVLEARNGYLLRLIHQETNARALLKGFTGPVLDVAFAHATSDLLACVDQGGNLFIWDLDRSPELSEAQR